MPRIRQKAPSGFWLVACGPAGGLNFQAGRITHKGSVQALPLQHMQQL